MKRKEVKTDQFQSPVLSDRQVIQDKLLTWARRRGYKAYRPKLLRSEEMVEEQSRDNDGTLHIVRRITVRPSVLEEHNSIRNEILFQHNKGAYFLAHASQQIGPFHPLDQPEYVDFICLAKVPSLTTDLNKEQEEEWLKDVRNRIPKPSHERFQVAQIENKVEGLLIEIQRRGHVIVTIHSDDKLLNDFADKLKEPK